MAESRDRVWLHSKYEGGKYGARNLFRLSQKTEPLGPLAWIRFRLPTDVSWLPDSGTRHDLPESYSPLRTSPLFFNHSRKYSNEGTSLPIPHQSFKEVLSE